MTTPTTPACLPSRHELAEAIYEAVHKLDWAGVGLITRELFQRYADSVLALLASRAPQWQPIEFAQIKPGMRVAFVDGPAVVAFIVRTVNANSIHGTRGERESPGMRWWDAIYTDTTVDPRVQIVIDWMTVDDEDAARDLLARLDATTHPSQERNVA